MDQTSTTLGSRIRRARETAGLGQAEFARKIGVTPTNVWKWEMGHRDPKLRRLVDIAKLLGVSVDWLLGVREAA